MHNLRAALLMVLAMAAFAAEDALLKVAAATLVVSTADFLDIVAGFNLWVENLRSQGVLPPAEPAVEEGRGA